MSYIPAKFYVPVDDEQMDTKYQKNTHTKSQKQQEAEERKAQSQAAKRAKLDPDNVKSVQEVQDDRRRRLEDDDELELEFDEDDDEEEDDEDDEEDDEDDDEDEGEQEDDGDDKDTPKDDHTQATPAPARRASASELRERLHSKIEMLHRKRNPAGPAPDGPPSTKQELMEERRRQRGEMRDRRRRERKEARRQAKTQSAPAKDGARPKSDVPGSARQAGLLVGDAAAPERSAAAPAAPESRMSFSQVDFGMDSQRKNKYAVPSDPKAALAALEARKRRVETRVQKQVERGQDESQAREAADEAQRWGKAMAAAEGVRIRDNENMLKQTIKRREKTKAKSTKAWYVHYD